MYCRQASPGTAENLSELHSRSCLNPARNVRSPSHQMISPPSTLTIQICGGPTRWAVRTSTTCASTLSRIEQPPPRHCVSVSAPSARAAMSVPPPVRAMETSSSGSTAGISWSGAPPTPRICCTPTTRIGMRRSCGMPKTSASTCCDWNPRSPPNVSSRWPMKWASR